MSTSLYPTPHIVLPTAAHTNTIVLFHGTSGNGPEFASSLLGTLFPDPSLSDDASTLSFTDPPTSTSDRLMTLPSLLPYTKWVFPTGRLRPVTALGGRITNAWFNVHDFSDRRIGEDDSVSGLGESVVYLAHVVKREVEILDGLNGSGEGGKRVVVGGFSQGAAMSAILLLSGELGESEASPGVDVHGWIMMSGWLPFRAQIWEHLSSSGDAVERRYRARSYVRELLGLSHPNMRGGVLEEDNVYITHGTLDRKMLVEWGDGMRELLAELGCGVKMYVHDVDHWWSGDSLSGLVKWLIEYLGQNIIIE